MSHCNLRHSGRVGQVIGTFTSFCQTYDGAMCSDLRRHHCLSPTHGLEDSTDFSPGRRHLFVHRCGFFNLSDRYSFGTVSAPTRVHIFRCSNGAREDRPFCVPQHCPTLKFVVKAFGSVKHEGTTTSERQIGEICQALYTDFGTLRHHKNLRGKQLENLTRQPGSSRELKVPRPFWAISGHQCFQEDCVQ